MISFLFVMTVRALVTDAGEVVVVSQFLQSQLCRQLRVEVADPRLAQRGDLLGGGDGSRMAGGSSWRSSPERSDSAGERGRV